MGSEFPGGKIWHSLKQKQTPKHTKSNRKKDRKNSEKLQKKKKKKEFQFYLFYNTNNICNTLIQV